MLDKVLKKDLPPGFDIEGHRGCRGLLPENSVPAFIKALELGVTTLEMDLVITKDKQVVVSHEPYFSHEISLTPEQTEIPADQERSFNIYQMDYEQVKKFDTGSKVHPRFLSQHKIKVYKPLLKEVIDIAENYTQEKKQKPIQYNVEIKSTPEGDRIFHPETEEFSELVYEVLKEKNILDRTIIQCFDIRPLQYLRKKDPSLKLSLLVENPLSPEFNLKILGFAPAIYSPDYKLVDEKLIKFAKTRSIKILPWTVNNAVDIRKLINFGVHGIITDYPDLFE